MKPNNKSNNYYDILNTIIENTKKEWYLNMDNTKEKWESPQYPKAQINKAGKVVADDTATSEDRNAALAILNNWRSSHAYPLQVIASNLRLRNPNAIVVQRLKRLESITGKLERFPDMSLYRMQDLGGCRVIVDSIEEVYSAINKYKTSRIRHILKREYDYIQQPKTSGYRSYHMVYQFQSDKKETYNKNLLIEIQFRTKLQHTWATAVEMMGIYTKSNLKSSQGNQEILHFFTLVSSLFAIIEGTPVCPDTSSWGDELAKEIATINKKHNILSKLSSLNTVTKAIKNNIGNYNYKNGYFLLILDIEKNQLSIQSFKPSESELATMEYNEIEKMSDLTKDIVLVSAKSFDILQAAYPNYFTDIGNFIRDINRILNTFHVDLTTE